MNLGWYRMPGHVAGSLDWGFHQGHTISNATMGEQWVVAEGEIAAMGMILTTLRGEQVRRGRRYGEEVSR